MTKWQIKYQKKPTNYNDSRNAVVEAETAELATALLLQSLGEGNGVSNYILSKPVEYVEIPQAKGRVISLGGGDGK